MRSSSGVRRFLATLALLLACCGAWADNIEIQSASLALREEGYALDANFVITLTPTLEEILNKGVPLNFLLELEIIRPRWYWFNDRVLTYTQQYKLSYNSLTRQYRLSLGTLYRNFSTLAEALDFMSRLRNVPVADRGALQADTSYVSALRLRLDVLQLPKPFQITALSSREWNLSSDWYRFAVTP